MRDPLAMGFVERVGNFDGIAQDLIKRQRPLRQLLCKRLAFQILHDEIIGSVLMAHIVKNTDVRMIQTGNRSRFPFEALAEFGSA